MERWLTWLGGNPPSDSMLTRYMAALEADGKQRGTVDRHRRAIQAFYRHFNVPAPKARGWKYSIQEGERLALGTDMIAALVAAVREQGDAYCCGLLCLATVYGMRCEELSRVRPEDVDLPGERLYVRTVHGGQVRWTWVPPEARPWLDIAWPRTTARAVERLFADLWALATEAERPDGMAWHAVRRGLAVALEEAGVSESDGERFMRWKAGGRSMVRHYRNPSAMVGVQGVERVRREEEASRAYDEEVWERHPWVGLWA